MSTSSYLQDILGSIAERGRQLLPRAISGEARKADIIALSRAIVSSRGEASGVALAADILASLRSLSAERREAFYRFLVSDLGPDREAVTAAATRYIAEPSAAALARLQRAVDSPRQEFFRRLNFAPGATRTLVDLRRDMLARRREIAGLDLVEEDLMHLLSSWFNRGFLVLRTIDWNTPAAILEKIIAYEAVHEIQSWDDLRRRLDPADRQCFAFFHPSLGDDPLIFVEVALTGAVPGNIQGLLDERPKDAAAVSAARPKVAVFYSISNCQEGLRGISFGNFLIKQVVEELKRERASLETFVTLSPVPGFARWLARELADEASRHIGAADRVALQVLSDPAWVEETEEETIAPALLRLAAVYLLEAKGADGRPLDPVARFHLGNGARLDRLNWLGDVSERGLSQAHGLMVNYRYDLAEIERNHEAYANDGTVAASRSVRAHLKG